MPRLKEVKFQPYTLALFEVLGRHGMLSSLYLRQFFPKVDRFYFLHHLQELTDGGYLERPKALNDDTFIFNDFKVYCLREKAEALIGLQPRLTGDSRHKLMTGTITASIELNLPPEWKYISQAEILAGNLCQQTTAAFESSIQLKGHRWDAPIIPDQLFGIEYGDNNTRFFALETDRGTEPMTRPYLTRESCKETSIEKKVKQYESVMMRASFRKLGLPNIFPMFITTQDDAQQRVKKHRTEYILDEFKKLGRLDNFFLVKGIAGFHPYKRTPKLMPFIFTDPFMRNGEPLWLTNPDKQPV